MTEPTKQIDFVVVLSRGGFCLFFFRGSGVRGVVCVEGGMSKIARAHTHTRHE